MVGYRSVTASSFFDLQAVVIRGVNRASRTDIEKIVKMNSVQNGVWNSDIDLIKMKIEELKFVKNASISRILPNGFRVIVNERIPRAVVRISGKDYWVDEDAILLGRQKGSEKQPVFTMFGWDERKTETALEKNKKRVELFTKLSDEWKKFDLATRVRAVDLSDLREPRAIVSDSGEIVTIYLGNDDFRRGLQRGLENIAGRGKEVESIIVSGLRPVIGYRDS